MSGFKAKSKRSKPVATKTVEPDKDNIMSDHQEYENVLTSLADYYRLLDEADWTYQYSNGDAYRRGKEGMEKVKELSNQSSYHTDLYNMFISWFNDSVKQNKWLPKPKLEDVYGGRE